MRRRVAVPFKAGNKLVKTLNDLKEVLENHPEDLIPAVQDGRLQRFLKGFGRRFEEIFKEDLTPKEIIKNLGNFLGVEVNLKPLPEKKKVITETNELLEAINQKSLIVLGKGTFEVEGLELKEPLTLEGQGKNETFIKVKQLIIRNPNIVFKDLTLEADEVIFYEPIKKLENAAVYTKQEKSFIPNEIINIQNSEFKIDNIKNENLTISITFDDFQLTNVTLGELLKKSPKLVFEGIKIHIKEDLKIENANIEFKDCEILFYSDSGILAKEVTFIAENSTFQMASGVESYKNITLINCKGFIKNCKFLNLKGGRLTNEIKHLTRRDFKENILIGGALIILSKKKNFYEIRNSEFKNCSSQYGGAIYLADTLVKNCIFENCTASRSGGGIYARSYSKVENCEFKHCSAMWGGGVYAINSSTIENSVFKNCSAEYSGGGGNISDYSKVKYCEFENCSAYWGGGVYAKDFSIIKNCTLKSCFAKKGSGIYIKKPAYSCCNKLQNCNLYEENTQTTTTYNTNTTKEKKSSSDSSGCYITTATFKAIKTQNDRCEELELFRWYRDNILLKEPDGKQLIEEYYKTAPLIVKKINSRPDAEEIYKQLWENYLKVCLKELKRKNYKKVKTLYVEMVKELQKDFL